MSSLAIGSFALLAAGIGISAWLRLREFFSFLALLAVLAVVCGLIWGEDIAAALGLLGGGIVAAGLVGYIFRALMVLVLPERAGRFMKSAPLTASFGMLFIAVILLVSIFADDVAPFREREIVGDVWQLADEQFLLGTDNLGRDMFSRLIYGAQTTISVALAAGVLSFAVGMFLSFTAAVVGGWARSCHTTGPPRPAASMS